MAELTDLLGKTGAVHRGGHLMKTILFLSLLLCGCTSVKVPTENGDATYTTVGLFQRSSAVKYNVETKELSVDINRDASWFEKTAELIAVGAGVGSL